jgi:hypothetical protein
MINKVLSDWKKRKNIEEVEGKEQKKKESSGMGGRADKAEIGIGVKRRRGFAP